jgi:hypothetical protein
MEDTEATEFLHELENKWQGTISWKTFATWYCCSDGTLREYGVFLFKINNTFHFEDFYRESTIFGIPLPKKKNEKKFIKMERSFTIGDVADVFQISQKSALDIAEGRLRIEQAKKIGKFDKIFRKIVTIVKLKDGSAHCFELLDTKQFKTQLQ